MKIIRNIPGFFKLCTTLKELNQYKGEIEDAKAKGDVERECYNILQAEKVWSRNVLKMFGSELVVHGEENLPQEGPVVYIGNHQGYADIIAYAAALNTIQFGFVAKEDLGNIPLYGKWIRRIRSVLIKRDDPRASLKAIDEGIELIKKGFSLMIFPEGTRSKGPQPGDFKRGAFKLAVKPEVPIIPVSLSGSYKMYEETGILKGTRIDVMIHPPVETKGLSRKEEKEMCLAVEKTVKDGIAELQKLQGER
ncbi:1-acyl-sn-glycerol-3-phosphate acyltransferase [Anaerovorax odorimutans]|uniref:1-acyl-sn-glycerol-3-phosphate acyltransferase n=1 Tax=Anaerovorax odorimutans TaxID=109327 RepID=A0ABT1RQJ6_9FIRM|nr:lysophospholipid acyltransferase family protein [Anaerovorax odorimutans]MCQ4637472.1 1-acyl-sn-glycerol-3-phosphate acyltransferase [Anaerovorax odorimutans]